MKRYRVEIRGSHDVNLIAKFFMASSPQEACDEAIKLYGEGIKCSASVDRDEAPSK